VSETKVRYRQIRPVTVQYKESGECTVRVTVCPKTGSPENISTLRIRTLISVSTITYRQTAVFWDRQGGFFWLLIGLYIMAVRWVRHARAPTSHLDVKRGTSCMLPAHAPD